MQASWALNPEAFNLTDGFGSKVFDKLLTAEARAEAKEGRKRRYEDRKAGLTTLFAEKKGKLSAGRFFQNTCQLVDYKVEKYLQRK